MPLVKGLHRLSIQLCALSAHSYQKEYKSLAGSVKGRYQISILQLPGSPFENLKNLNKSENSSSLKVPDVGIQNDRIRTTITTQQTKKRSEFVSPRS